MVISLNEKYNGGFLPDILMRTQAPIVVSWLDDIIIAYYYYLLYYVPGTVLSLVFAAFGALVWRLM